MSTSLIYHAFGANTYNYRSTKYKRGSVFIHIEKKKRNQRCIKCNSRNVTLEGKEKYTIRTIPIGMKSVFFVLHLHYLHCHDCGSILQENRDLADPRKTYSQALARYVIELSKQMTMLAIARHLKLGWHIVKSIIKEHLQKKAKKRSWRNVRYIAIDEIAIRKGHNYMTVVLDLETGQALYTAEVKDQECLKDFFTRLRRARAPLSAVAIDMSNAFINAVRDYWPDKNLPIIHDHYHIVSNMNTVIDKVRRDEQNQGF